jgi:hypothetical protein
MGFVAELWMPILLSAVFAFVVSSLIHMVLTYHKSDMKKLPNEDAVMDALRPFNIPPGDYSMPMCDGPKDMKAPEYLEKMKKGPVALMTVIAPGPINMGKYLLQWFIFMVVVNIFVAYIASHTIATGADYLAVFRVVGTAAFMGYAMAQIPNSIWFMRNWCSTLKMMFDGLLYALVSAGTFGWLWPRG